MENDSFFIESLVFVFRLCLKKTEEAKQIKKHVIKRFKLNPDSVESWFFLQNRYLFPKKKNFPV